MTCFSSFWEPDSSHEGRLQDVNPKHEAEIIQHVVKTKQHEADVNIPSPDFCWLIFLVMAHLIPTAKQPRRGTLYS